MSNVRKVNSPFLLYRGKPLVRCGNTIYYGDMKDKFVAKIEIKSSENQHNIDMCNKATVQLIDTDPEISIRKKIVKSSEKSTLYSAIDIANVWLERSLSQ